MRVESCVDCVCLDLGGSETRMGYLVEGVVSWIGGFGCVVDVGVEFQLGRVVGSLCSRLLELG